jgi:hypothetical protein
MVDIDLLEAFHEDSERKLNEVAVFQALCSYHLAKNAEKQKLSEPTEEIILEIFRIILSSNNEIKGITCDELNHMRKLLFWDNGFYFMPIIQNLMKQGKLTYTPCFGYQLAPQAEVKE